MFTKTSDIPDVIKSAKFFTKTVSKKVIDGTELTSSRAFKNDPVLNEAANTAKSEIVIPFNSPLKGRSQLYTEGKLDVNSISTSVQHGIANYRAQVFSSTDLTTELSGDNKLEAIADYLSDYWGTDLEETVNLILEGVFKASSMSGNKLTYEYNADEVEKEIGRAITQAELKLGKQGQKQLRTIYCSPELYQKMQLANLVTPVRDASDANITINRYLNKYDVVVTDNLDGLDFYLLGDNVILYGDGSEYLQHSTETGRDSLESKSYIINRRKYFVHVNGVSFVGTLSSHTPKDAELSTGTNWKREFDNNEVLAVKVTMTEAVGG